MVWPRSVAVRCSLERRSPCCTGDRNPIKAGVLASVTALAGMLGTALGSDRPGGRPRSESRPSEPKITETERISPGGPHAGACATGCCRWNRSGLPAMRPRSICGWGQSWRRRPGVKSGRSRAPGSTCPSTSSLSPRPENSSTGGAAGSSKWSSAHGARLAIGITPCRSSGSGPSGSCYPTHRSCETGSACWRVKARVEIAEHKYDDAIRTIETGLAFSRHLAEGPFLINQLVGITWADMMLDSRRGIGRPARRPEPVLGADRPAPPPDRRPPGMETEQKMGEWMHPRDHGAGPVPHRGGVGLAHGASPRPDEGPRKDVRGEGSRRQPGRAEDPRPRRVQGRVAAGGQDVYQGTAGARSRGCPTTRPSSSSSQAATATCATS